MTVRVTHTPCGQAVDLTDDNRILTAGTDATHQCTGPAGPWTPVPIGSRWTVEFVLDPHQAQPVYDTQLDAQADADQRNTAYERAHAPKPPQPQQAALFDQQEAI